MLLAGSVDIGQAMQALRGARRVFHSEADLQHAFAWEVHRIDPAMRVRLETHPEPAIRLDLRLSRPDLGRYTAIELKYLTAHWSGEIDGEVYALKNHGAEDVRAYDVVKDIGRVERFVSGRTGWNGAVLVLTNDPNYWKSPAHGRETNAQAFRLHEGTVLSGIRAWGARTGAGTMKKREAELNLEDSYRCAWQDYSTLPNSRTTLRYLVLPVEGGE